MANLGVAKIFIKHDQLVTGIVIAGINDQPIAGAPMRAPFRPKDGDRITIQFEEMQEKPAATTK